MREPQLRTAVPAPRGGKPLREGLRFVWRDPVLRSTFVILTIVSILGLAFAFATDRWSNKRDRSGEHGAATPSFLSCGGV